jgi:hypothetical protein
MPNNRVYYAIHSVAFKDNSAPPTNEVVVIRPGVDVAPTGFKNTKIWEVARGAQSVGMTTTFNFEQVFELGQLETYEYIEAEPEIEMTVEKVLDGTKPLYFMTTRRGATSLTDRTATYRTDVAVPIYSDTKTRATGDPISMVLGSGMYLSSVSYTFPVDGNFTESISLVGNDKLWADVEGITGSADQLPSATGAVGLLTGTTAFPVGFPSGTQFLTLEDASVIGSGVQRREQFRLDNSRLPTEIPGVSSSGTLATIREHIQTITTSVDLGREDIFELGRKRPYTKFVTFPVEVTCSVEAITSQGDFVDAQAFDETCRRSTNTTNQQITLELCEGLIINLGAKNRLQSVEMAGGEAGGGNMTVTYNYSNFNDFTISHRTFT